MTGGSECSDRRLAGTRTVPGVSFSHEASRQRGRISETRPISVKERTKLAGEGDLPCLDGFFHRHEGLEQEVDMVRHHEPGLVDVFLTVELHEYAPHEVAAPSSFFIAAKASASLIPLRKFVFLDACELEFEFSSPKPCPFAIVFGGEKGSCIIVLMGEHCADD